MTEDDTFNALRRISFDVMREIYLKWFNTSRLIHPELGPQTIENINNFLRAHYWTYDEFAEEWEQHSWASN